MKQGVKVLYHDNCTDGFGAAFAAWTFFNNENRVHKYDVTYVPVQHYQPPTYILDIDGNHHIHINKSIELLQKDMVYILDFSYKREDIRRIEDHVQFLSILDHHKTAEIELNGLCCAEFDMDRSGAMMAWQHFNGHNVPKLIQYIQDQDLWHHKLPHSQDITRWIRSYKMDFNLWSKLLFDMECRFDIVVQEAKGIERAYRQSVASIKQNARFLVDAGKRKLAIVNCNAVFVSDVCHDLINEHGLQYAIGWYLNNENKYILGFRGNKDTDVSLIAKIFKGGGHKAAAGGVVDNLTDLYYKLGAL